MQATARSVSLGISAALPNTTYIENKICESKPFGGGHYSTTNFACDLPAVFSVTEINIFL